MARTKVAELSDLWPGEMKAVCVERRKILLVHLEDGVHAYEDRCPHVGTPLSLGRMEGERLICSAHEWVFDARTGRGENPCGVRLRSLAVAVEDGSIVIDVEP